MNSIKCLIFTLPAYVEAFPNVHFCLSEVQRLDSLDFVLPVYQTLSRVDYLSWFLESNKYLIIYKLNPLILCTICHFISMLQLMNNSPSFKIQNMIELTWVELRQNAGFCKIVMNYFLKDVNHTAKICQQFIKIHTEYWKIANSLFVDIWMIWVATNYPILFESGTWYDSSCHELGCSFNWCRSRGPEKNPRRNEPDIWWVFLKFC